jgi:hypothetical protein
MEMLSPSELEPLIDSPEFQALDPEKRGRVFNNALREAHQWVGTKSKTGWTPEKVKDWGTITQGLREKATSESVGEWIGGALGTVGQVVADSAATLGAAAFSANLPGTSPLPAALYANVRKVGESGESFVSTKDDILGNQLMGMKRNIDTGEVPDSASGWKEWLDTQHRLTKEAQIKAYTVMEGDTPEARAYAESNSLLGNKKHTALLADYLKTRDPAVWDQLRTSLSVSPGRAKLESEQDRIANRTMTGMILNNAFGKGAGDYLNEAGDPMEVAGMLLPLFKGAKVVKAIKGGSKAKAAAGVVAGAAGEAVSELGSQFMDDPTATWQQRLEVAKEAFIGGLGLAGVGAGVGAVKERFSPEQTPDNDPTSPTQTTAPTQPPAAGQPVAAAPAGTPVSPLSGIAERGGRIDPTLPDDTGELTAEDVEDLETLRLGDLETETLPTPGAGAIRPQPGASRVTEEGSIPSTAPLGAGQTMSDPMTAAPAPAPLPSQDASVTKDSGPTADQTAQVSAPGAGLSPAAGARFRAAVKVLTTQGVDEQTAGSVAPLLAQSLPEGIGMEEFRDRVLSEFAAIGGVLPNSVPKRYVEQAAAYEAQGFTPEQAAENARNSQAANQEDVDAANAQNATVRRGLTNLQGGNRSNAGSSTLPGEAAAALVSMAQTALRAGQNFAQWAASMVQRFGEAVRQYLQGAWQAATQTSEVGALNFTSALGPQLQAAANNRQPRSTTVNNGQLLTTAHAAAARGSSTQMVPIRRVYEEARRQNPALTQEQFQASESWPSMRPAPCCWKAAAAARRRRAQACASTARGRWARRCG